MSETKEKKGIQTGALRRVYNEALERKIVCRNQLLISLASMEYRKEYGFTEDDKLKTARVLKEKGYEPSYILLILPQIDKKYFPTDVQIKRLLEIVDGEYLYIDDFIKDSLLKSVNQEELTGKKTVLRKKKRLSAQELKRYIYEKEQIQFILEEMGCTQIKYHENKKYFSCTNVDGDNASAVNVKNDEYLGVKNFYSESILQKNYYFEFMDKSFYDEGITEEARKKFGLLLSRSENKEWCGTIIPLRHYETGKLLGTNLRRNLSDIEMQLYDIKGKYHTTPSYPKKRNVYGLWENKGTIKGK